MHQVGTIKSIFRYPVKSMAGEQLTSAELGWHGINGDRRFAFVRAGNMSGFPWLTASKMPELIRYKAYHTDAGDALSPSVRVRTPDGIDVEVESESLRQQLIAAYGTDITLIRVDNGIFDDSPVSLISTTTIKNLETESGCSLDARRFRPNLLIESINNAPVLEATWIGKTLVLGDHAQSPAVRITIQDVRCVMVNLDPETAVAEPRVLKTIARSQKNCAGVYASMMKVGTVSAGDRVFLDED
ncbi:MAG: MOSC domain-containing protein [Ignavibacteria bacterium]|nr:MOSC domain-containing protein [Ignavibacteria bacterium]MBI3766762.1 MOSC domain-containing protein [Ignavibacteriales bacterium]